MTPRNMFFCLIFLFQTFLGASEDIVELSFQNLSSHEVQDKRVRITGFLYKKENQWVLASVPNLKTCCVGCVKKKNDQLLVSGTLNEEPTTNALTLEGNFKTENGLYYLSEASLVKTSKKPFYPYLLASVPLTALLSYFFLKKKNQVS